MKPIHLIFIILTFIVVLTGIVNAQPSLPAPPTQAPIDGGLGLLAAAGGAYAWKKLKNRRN